MKRFTPVAGGSSPGEQKCKTVVVSQPMYFPWVGQLEQVRLADTFVFYDDVPFSRGSFSNRVQIKTESGTRWLTVPLKGHHLGQLICDAALDQDRRWPRTHMDSFRQAYVGAPFLNDALGLMDSVLSSGADNLADLSINSTLALVRYFSLDLETEFVNSSSLGVTGSSSQRVIDVCLNRGATKYLTGHGARNYLDHLGFENEGIEVTYIDYGCAPYLQLHGAFTPYVSALDLVANCGRQGRDLLHGRAVPWRDFLKQQKSGKGRRQE